MGNHHSRTNHEGDRFFTSARTKRCQSEAGKSSIETPSITLSVANSDCAEMIEKQQANMLICRNNQRSDSVSNHVNTSDGESPDSTQIDEDIDSLFSYLNGWLDDEVVADIGPPEQKRDTLSSVPEVDENDQDYSDLDTYAVSKNDQENSSTKNEPWMENNGGKEPIYTIVVKPPRKSKISQQVPAKRPKRQNLANHNQVLDLLSGGTHQRNEMDFSSDRKLANIKEEVVENIYARIKDFTLETDSHSKDGGNVMWNSVTTTRPLSKSNLNQKFEPTEISHSQPTSQLVALRTGVINPANAVYRRPSFKSLPKSECDRILEEGTIVQSVFSFTNPMPGTLSFSTGQTGMVMRRNVGGWCYVCLRSGEGWAPADYWATVPLNSDQQDAVLAKKHWFFGFVSRPDCEFLLLTFGDEGDFLVRNSTVRNCEFTLSLRHKDVVHHFAVRRENSRHFLIGKLSYKFESLDAIISHYHQHTILSDTVALLEKPFSYQF